MDEPLPFGDIPSLLQRYAGGALTPSRVVEAVHAAIEHDPDHHRGHGFRHDQLI